MPLARIQQEAKAEKITDTFSASLTYILHDVMYIISFFKMHLLTLQVNTKAI